MVSEPIPLQKSFEIIYGLVERNWNAVHEPLHHNAVFLIRDRLAVTMFYLTHPGGLTVAASIFGMSKATALRSVREVVEVVISTILPRVIRLP